MLRRLTLTSIASAMLLCASCLQAAPVSLFDGKSLDLWEGDSKWWSVKNGEIHGGSTTEKIPHNYFLATRKTYKNYELKLKIKLSGDPKTGLINSGIQICSLRVPDSTEMSGFQVDAGDGWYGKMYDESRRNKVIATSANQAAVDAAVKKSDWNDYIIRVEGPRIRSWINGTAALDYTETDPKIAQDGHIAIQIHSGGIALVQVKDITIEELPDTPNPITWQKVGAPVGKKTSMKEGNVLDAKPKTAQEQLKTFQVPEGFEVELVAEEDPEAGIGKFIAVHFDEKGRMWSMTAVEYPVDGNEAPDAAKALYASKARDKVVVFDTPFAKGPQKGRVFADGLAIPLGILPYQDGCYALHGPDLVFLRDENGDGKADSREVILTGFGVQDSHLFPHQFTRAPGGWIWLAQGAFNYSMVRRPNDPPERALQFDQTRMAKLRPDGSEFDITSNGPCNIWGLALTGEGEAFIQEANDAMYSVMPFHEYANYPGCSVKQWKSYAPELPAIADFRMGGTGLSGLALTDANGPFPEAWADVMLVANPITRVINAVKLHRQGTSWKAEKLSDFLTSTDPMFRPVAMTLGPDGCVYIVDWYNKIISHNEVARNHPDRDKIRGRIWRIRPKAKPSFEMVDFTKLPTADLIQKLGSASTAQSHFAWQTLADRELSKEEIDQLHHLILREDQTVASRIQALWVLSEKNQLQGERIQNAFESPHRNLRRELTRAWSRIVLNQSSQTSEEALAPLKPLLHLKNDQDPEVRAELIRACGVILDNLPEEARALRDATFQLILTQAQAALDEPMGKSTWNGKPIKVGAAYEREFERYLVRLHLEKHPSTLYDFLTSKVGDRSEIEARLLAALALPEPISASLVADLLLKLDRAPNSEELLRLISAMDQPDVGIALKKTLENPATRDVVLRALLQVKDHIDAAKVTPLITEATKELLSQSPDQVSLAIQLTSSFRLKPLAPELTQLAKQQAQDPKQLSSLIQIIKALGEIGAGDLSFYKELILKGASQELKDEATLTLASQADPAMGETLLSVWKQISPLRRRIILDRLCTHVSSAQVLLQGLETQVIPQDILEISHIERLQTLLPKNAQVQTIVKSIEGRSVNVLLLDGQESAWVQTQLELPGAFTVETWVRIQPTNRQISNADGILSTLGVFDINLHASKPRVFSAQENKDIITAKKALMPNTWTHIAVTRDAKGFWKIYLDGELSETSKLALNTPIRHPRVGASYASGGTQGVFAGYRIWDKERSADEIRSSFDRDFPAGTPNLIYHPVEPKSWGSLGKGASLAKTLDSPPLLSADAAKALDAQFEKYRKLAHQPGNKEQGKIMASICMGCHLIQEQGINMGPNLSGVGAMGVEAILRNILTPNAAMESAYRVYRVELKDGSVKEGFLASEDKEAILLRTVGVADQRIPKTEIRHSEFLRRSLMPEGLLNPLPDQAVSDLFEYLKSLK